MDEIREKVRQFITTNFYVEDAAALGDEVSLLDSGIIDSTGVMEVITFLESEFEISVGDTEILPENLDGIGNLTRYVQKKRG